LTEQTISETGQSTPARDLREVDSYRIEGFVTALSSIAHGGETAGTMRLLRREKIVGPDGAVVELPVVSGNAIRGILRDYSADRLWHQLGKPQLSRPEFQALWSGGALAKAGASNVISTHQLRDLRQLIPHLALLGAAGGGSMLEGRLMVGKAMPVCAETAHIMPDGANTPDTSIWDMVQIEEFTRSDDTKRGWADRQLARDDTEAGADDGQPQQMRYGIETIAAGTRLHWWIQLVGVSQLEAQCFADAMRDWSRDGAHVGGRSATGHGRLRIDADGWEHPTPALTAGTSLPTAAAAGADSEDLLGEHVDAHRDEIREAISWLAV